MQNAFYHLIQARQKFKRSRSKAMLAPAHEQPTKKQGAFEPNKSVTGVLIQFRLNIGGFLKAWVSTKRGREFGKG